MDLLQFTENGIYCAAADVYLDPWNPVERALITHGHADHARHGSKSYLCTASAAPVIKHRLKLTDGIQTVAYGESIKIKGIEFSFHPAGHVLGSAQVRVADGKEVWVFSGDYKLQSDGISEPFEPVHCDAFITESTFALPIYKWKPQSTVIQEINNWWRKNQHDGKVSILSAYALGKAQRILKNIDSSIGPIFLHGAIDNITQVIRSQGVVLPETSYAGTDAKKKDYKGALVICPPSAVNSPWMKKFNPYAVGIASGWMNLRGTRRRKNADRGFVLSDHVDWDELNLAVRETGAERIFVTHGYSDAYAQWLRAQGRHASVSKTQYEGDEMESPAESLETSHSGMLEDDSK
jgi:putative mRNA 3-end processing factor